MSAPALSTQLDAALAEALGFIDAARAGAATLCAPDGMVEPDKLNLYQHEAHGFAWMAAYGEALRALAGWVRELEDSARLTRGAQLAARIAAREYLAQLSSAIPLAQDEFFRPGDLGLEAEAARFAASAEVVALRGPAGSTERAEFIEILRQSGPGALVDMADAGETIALARQQFRAFADKEIAPRAQNWHLQNALLPLDLIQKLGKLGVFGLTAPEEYGGSGLGAAAMCAVTEELSRGYIGAGSLGTRSEIAVELIRSGGTEAQKQRWIKPIIAGDVLPTAVFTEPNAGSDLASLATRAERDGTHYRLFGAKTWITHAARADLMLVLARTGEAGSGHRGISLFLVPKPRGGDSDPFPLAGMSGSEIPVLGYRGMREYEIAFDGLRIPADALLGECEGEGFIQLMKTFELARIQTAARALGVAQNAFELAFAYAYERRQFGRAIIEFPRVHNKLAWMAAETAMLRQLVASVARKKEAGGRCDVEAGMAKLLAARCAWSAADNGLQIHGGNGYALEYPASRLLCDARILNIFEGAAEIQAHVIARGLLGSRP